MRKLILAIAMTVPCVFSASATRATEFVPVSSYYGGYYYWPYYDGYRPPACPYRYHWECWLDPYGRPGCGCRPDFGLYPGLY